MPERLIAAYGLEAQKLGALSVFCDRENIRLRAVSPAEADCTVGMLCGLTNEPPAPVCAEPPSGECLVFSGFDRQGLNDAVNSLRAGNIKVALKAVCTPHNCGWTLAALIAELEKEHAYMSGKGGAK